MTNTLLVWHVLTASTTWCTAQGISPADRVERQAAEKSSQLNADVPNEYCRVDYGKIVTVTSKLYSPETKLCGLWQATVCKDELASLMLDSFYSPGSHFCELCRATICRDELTAEPHSTLMYLMCSADYGSTETTTNSLSVWHVLTTTT